MRNKKAPSLAAVGAGKKAARWSILLAPILPHRPAPRNPNAAPIASFSALWPWLPAMIASSA